MAVKCIVHNFKYSCVAMFLSLTVVLKVFHTQSGRKKAHIVVSNSLSPSDTAKRNFSQARAVCLMLRNKQYKNVNFADVYYPCNISEFLTLCKVSHAAISRVRALIMLKITDWIRHWSELQWQDVDTKFRECRSPSLTVAHTHTWHDDLKSTHFFFFNSHLLLSTRVLPPGYVTGYLQCVFFYSFTLHMLFPSCTCCLILFCCV